jgi:hypothetical protein
MLEILVQYKKPLIRTLGALLLLIGFVIHFWVTPKEGLSEIEIAAANVARMEASVSGKSTSTKTQSTGTAPFFEEFKSTREKQMQYLTIIVMVLGAGFLLYSFFQKEKD